MKNKTTLKGKIFFGLIIFYVLLIVGNGVFRYKGPWEGQLIDIDTKKPIAGAAVLAVWNIEGPSVDGTIARYFRSREIVTDKNGYYKIPAYFPINLFPILTNINNPTFHFYKPGYLPQKFSGNQLLSITQEKKITTPRYGRDHSVTYVIAPGRLELPRLHFKTRKQARINCHIPPSVPENEMPYYLQLNDEERESLGLTTRKSLRSPR